MRNKKIIMYVIIIFLILFILGIGFLVINNHRKSKKTIIKEYTPEAEITDEQLRETNIILYFEEIATGNLITEVKKIDSKKLLNCPEKEIIEYLISGPKDNNLKKLIPENTKLINVERIKNILIINFSEEFIINQNLGKEQEEKIIQSILKTVSQLNEIDGIKILINGEENKAFPDNGINFTEIFTI